MHSHATLSESASLPASSCKIPTTPRPPRASQPHPPRPAESKIFPSTQTPTTMTASPQRYVPQSWTPLSPGRTSRSPPRPTPTYGTYPMSLRTDYLTPDTTFRQESGSTSPLSSVNHHPRTIAANMPQCPPCRPSKDQWNDSSSPDLTILARHIEGHSRNQEQVHRMQQQRAFPTCHTIYHTGRPGLQCAILVAATGQFPSI